MLRVLHVAEAFGGGLFEMVRFVAAGSVAAGHDVAIAYGRRPETPDAPADLLPGVATHALPWGERTVGEQVRVARALRTLAAEHRPDVIHLHSSFAAVVGGVALRAVAPIVYTPHAFASCLPTTSAPARAVLRSAERLAIRRADHVGAVSASEALCAAQRGARRLSVIPNGIAELDPDAPVRVDRELARLASARPSRPQVMAAGRIVAQRQPEAAARILGMVRDVADVSWVGGGGEDTAWAREARAELARRGVHHTGWVPREAFLDALADAKVYLHWTSWDGQALSLLEALARDAIVVASDIPPNREVVPAAQLCRTEDEAAALVRRIVTDPAFAARRLREQRARAERFGAQRMVAGWLALYDRLAGRDVPVPAAPVTAPTPELV